MIHDRIGQRYYTKIEEVQILSKIIWIFISLSEHCRIRPWQNLMRLGMVCIGRTITQRQLCASCNIRKTRPILARHITIMTTSWHTLLYCMILVIMSYVGSLLCRICLISSRSNLRELWRSMDRFGWLFLVFFITFTKPLSCK